MRCPPQVVVWHEGRQHTVEPLPSAADAALVLDVLTGGRLRSLPMQAPAD